MNMSAPEKKTKEPKTDKPEPKKGAERGEEKSSAKIDFAKLDLSIEKVDERISPSETNVFDK
jgi:hypothetical protein